MSWDDESAWARDDDAFAASEERHARREAADAIYLDPPRVHCGDCGGTGSDLGSLHEPEECPACLGRGYMLGADVVAVEPRRGLKLKGNRPSARVA